MLVQRQVLFFLFFSQQDFKQAISVLSICLMVKVLLIQNVSSGCVSKIFSAWSVLIFNIAISFRQTLSRFWNTIDFRIIKLVHGRGREIFLGGKGVDIVLSLSISSCWKSMCMYIYIFRYVFQKYISQIIITSTRMLYHVNSYFLHASKLSNPC